MEYDRIHQMLIQTIWKWGTSSFHVIFRHFEMFATKTADQDILRIERDFDAAERNTGSE